MGDVAGKDRQREWAVPMRCVHTTLGHRIRMPRTRGMSPIRVNNERWTKGFALLRLRGVLVALLSTRSLAALSACTRLGWIVLFRDAPRPLALVYQAEHHRW